MILFLLFALLVAVSIKYYGKGFLVFFIVVTLLQLYIGGVVNLSGDFSYFLLFETMFYPVVSVLCVLFVHKRFLALRHENSHLKESFEELEKNSKELFKNYQNDHEIRVNLEKRILRDDSFALKLQQNISSLSSFSTAEIKGKLLEIVHEFINARSSSYYGYKGNRFYLERSYGEEVTCSLEIRQDNPIFYEAIRSSTPLSVKDGLSKNSEGIVMIGVLRDKNSKVLGAIAIHKIDFLDINYTTVQMFEMLCSWASMAIEKASVYESKLKDSITFADTNILNYDYFKEVLDREVKLSKRYDSFFSVVTMRIDGFENIEDSFVLELIELLYVKLGIVLRDVDSAYLNHITKDRFYILLPNTKKEGAEVVIKKIGDSLKKSSIKPYKDKRASLKSKFSIFFVDKYISNSDINNFLKDNG